LYASIYFITNTFIEIEYQVELDDFYDNWRATERRNLFQKTYKEHCLSIDYNLIQLLDLYHLVYSKTAITTHIIYDYYLEMHFSYCLTGHIGIFDEKFQETVLICFKIDTTTGFYNPILQQKLNLNNCSSSVIINDADRHFFDIF
jgi:hypothetical protein